MTEIFYPFRQIKTLKQVLLCALIFIGMAVPFKVMTLIEGLTEVRPVNAVPVVVGLLFGPAGAWGCGIGNLIADLFGTFSLSSILGFVGNFIAAYLPYRLWYTFNKQETPNVKSYKNIGIYFLVSAMSSVTTAIFITGGLDLFLQYWSRQLFIIISLNDFLFPVLLGLPILIVLTCDDHKINVNRPKKEIGFRMPHKLCFILFLVSAVGLIIMIGAGCSVSSSVWMLLLFCVFIGTMTGTLFLN